MMMHQHNHTHQNDSIEGKPLAVANKLKMLITFAWIVCRNFWGSLALFGHTLHNFSDVLSIIISYPPIPYVARKSPAAPG